jgi:general secretion pathway protein G
MRREDAAAAATTTQTRDEREESADYNDPMSSHSRAQAVRARDTPGSPVASSGKARCAQAVPARDTVPTNGKRECGFTLIEIMVVIVILGVLAALVVPSVLSRTDDARSVAARSDLAAIRQALKLYRLDNQRYPTTEQGLNALVTRPTEPPLPPNWKPGGYLEKLPRDPWGHPYQYLNPGVKSDVDVLTYGADGQAGGTGADADIGSWDL